MPDVEAAASSAKKRGRPAKSVAPAVASGESDEPVVKRGRGRPKGSKSTKKKETAPKPTGPKRPRGRPKGSVKKKPESNDKSATPKKSPKKASEWWTFLHSTSNDNRRCIRGDKTWKLLPDISIYTSFAYGIFYGYTNM